MLTSAYKVGGWGEKRPKICLRNIWMVPYVEFPTKKNSHFFVLSPWIFVSRVVSIPACHAGDRGSIPRQRGLFFSHFFISFAYSDFFKGSWEVECHECAWVTSFKNQSKKYEKMWEKQSSLSGNWTPVSRVTGGDTYHYTNKDSWEETKNWEDSFFGEILKDLKFKSN